MTSGYAESRDLASNKGKEVEIIDLANQNFVCTPLGSIANLTLGSTGNQLDSTPIVCGGQDLSNSDKIYKTCQIIGTEKVIELKEERSFAGNLVINEKLWITGGISSSGMLKTTEFVTLEGSEIGPDLPIRMTKHCTTQIGPNKVMFIGGDTESESESQKTWIYDLEDRLWTQSPEFETQRIDFSCATFQKEDKTTVVLLGGNSVKVEFFDVESSQWSWGPDFPVKIKGLVALGFDSEVFTIGGESESGMISSIYNLKCDSEGCFWTELEQKLSKSRSYHVAMFVPSNITECSASSQSASFSAILFAFVIYLCKEN